MSADGLLAGTVLSAAAGGNGSPGCSFDMPPLQGNHGGSRLAGASLAQQMGAAASVPVRPTGGAPELAVQASAEPPVVQASMSSGSMSNVDLAAQEEASAGCASPSRSSV